MLYCAAHTLLTATATSSSKSAVLSLEVLCIPLELQNLWKITQKDNNISQMPSVHACALSCRVSHACLKDRSPHANL